MFVRESLPELTTTIDQQLGKVDEQIKKLKQKVGELVLDLDILREAAKGRPTDPTTSGE